MIRRRLLSPSALKYCSNSFIIRILHSGEPRCNQSYIRISPYSYTGDTFCPGNGFNLQSAQGGERVRDVAFIPKKRGPYKKRRLNSEEFQLRHYLLSAP